MLNLHEIQEAVKVNVRQLDEQAKLVSEYLSRLRVKGRLVQRKNDAVTRRMSQVRSLYLPPRFDLMSNQELVQFFREFRQRARNDRTFGKRHRHPSVR